MGNTCVGPNLTKNAFFQSVSATIWRFRSNNESLPPASDTGPVKDSSVVATNAPKPVEIDGIDSKPSKVPGVVGNPAPENPSKKPVQVKRIESSVGLQAGSVLKRKTENLKEIYSLGRKLGQGQFGTTFLCVEKATGKEYVSVWLRAEDESVNGRGGRRLEATGGDWNVFGLCKVKSTPLREKKNTCEPVKSTLIRAPVAPAESTPTLKSVRANEESGGLKQES